MTTRLFTFGIRAVDEAARSWIADGSPVAEPRQAATVLLLRDSADGIEVFMQRRASTMAFAPSMVVFPGGRIDPSDLEAEVDPKTVSVAAARFGIGEDLARGALAAAVREVGEEAGVTLSADDLRPRSRWVTPAFEPRRYDTFFFAARLPDGQEAVGETSETTEDFWGSAPSMLAEAEAGTFRLMPPTTITLEQVAAFDSVSDFLAEEPELPIIEPELLETPTGFVMQVRLP